MQGRYCQGNKLLENDQQITRKRFITRLSQGEDSPVFLPISFLTT